MSRLVVVSNRVAPIKPGKVAAGGLAVGVYDALRQAGGIWFGWSGEINATPAINTEEVGNITYVTLPLNKRDYDQYYRGFSNNTLVADFSLSHRLGALQPRRVRRLPAGQRHAGRETPTAA